MDRETLKEKMRLAISVRRCPDDTCRDQDVGNGLCQCEVDASAALTAIEDAGYIIMPKDQIVKQMSKDEFSELMAGVKFKEPSDV